MSWLKKSLNYDAEMFIINSIDYCKGIHPAYKKHIPLSNDEMKLFTDEFIRSCKYYNLIVVKANSEDIGSTLRYNPFNLATTPLLFIRYSFDINDIKSYICDELTSNIDRTFYIYEIYWVDDKIHLKYIF